MSTTTDTAPIEASYQESDLGTAAFLQVRGFRLLGLSPLGGGRWAFRFADSEGKAAQVALDYLQGAPVPALSLVEAQKGLKTLLYSKWRRNGNGNLKRDRF